MMVYKSTILRLKLTYVLYWYFLHTTRYKIYPVITQSLEHYL